jgi:hypothetical protein
MLTRAQIEGKGAPGGDRVSKMKESLAGINTLNDQLSDRLGDTAGNPVDKSRIAASIHCMSDARIEVPEGQESPKAMVLYCGGDVMRTFLFTNAPLKALAGINPALRHQLTEDRSITLVTHGKKLWYIFLAPSEIEKLLAAPRAQPAEACGAPCAKVLELYVAGKDRHPSGIDLPAVAPKATEHKPQPRVSATYATVLPSKGQLAGARMLSNTLNGGVTIEEFSADAEPVPGSHREEKLCMRNGSPITSIGEVIAFRGKKYMLSNIPPEDLADHGATGYLVSSARMKINVADVGTIYITEVCKDAPPPRLFESPHEDVTADSGKAPLFGHPYEAVRWAARRAAKMAEGRLVKEVIGDGFAATLIAASDERFFIVTDGPVDEACGVISSRYETATERMMITPGFLDLRSAQVELQSGETVRIKIAPASVKISEKKPEQALPPSPMAPNGVLSPSTTGTTELSGLIALNVGVPADKEGVATLLKCATLPTPQSVLHGDAEAMAAFDQRRRFLKLIATNVRYVIEHNGPSDPLVFTTIRVDIGGQGLSFNLFRLKSGMDGLDPTLKDLPHSLVLTDSIGWYILVPTYRMNDIKKQLLESTMTR